MKNSKFQIPSSKEDPSFRLQSVAPPVLGIDSWNFLGFWNLDFGIFLACAACYGKSDSPLAFGMNWGIFTLMGVILSVLTCFALFFVHIARGEKAQIESENNSNPPPPNPPGV
jgi:hypothetical protein